MLQEQVVLFRDLQSVHLRGTLVEIVKIPLLKEN
uniref:Uncharacterized protein n=1 Tax=Arundo donax TaxID=35708 RepID=A0A0A8ZSR9_ARUDO